MEQRFNKKIPMKKLLTLLIGNKITLFITALVAGMFLPLGTIYYENIQTYDSGLEFLNQWSLWDANSYIQIARDGYFGRYFAYFPLYPIVLKLASYLTLGNYALAGLLLNLGFSFAAAYLLFKICKEEFKDEKIGLWANVFLFFFPTAFFFTAIYTEGMFLFLGIAVMYFLRNKNWLAVAVAAFFAAMTREVGGMLILPIAYVALQDFKSNKLKKILAILSPILGVLAVLLIYAVTSGDPLIFLKQHEGFGKTLSLPYVPIINAISGLSIYNAWNLACFLFTAILTWQVYKRLPKQYLLYCLAVLLPPLCSSNLEGYSRYLLVAFPMFMILGTIKNNLLRAGYLVIAVPLLLLLCIRYVTGAEWVNPF